MTADVCAILPALNEADALEAALAGKPENVRVVVVDNGSTDGTADVARSLGVDVVAEPRRGFGYACAAGLEAAGGAKVLVYLDADATCDWADLQLLTEPVLSGRADLVLGRRAKDRRSPGAMAAHVVIANRVLSFLCGRLAGTTIHDVPPYRAIDRTALQDLALTDRTYGWPLEMILKAGRSGLRIVEVPVAYHRRVGTSKVTGTLRGTLHATAKMGAVLWRYRR